MRMRLPGELIENAIPKRVFRLWPPPLPFFDMTKIIDTSMTPIQEMSPLDRHIGSFGWWIMQP